MQSRDPMAPPSGSKRRWVALVLVFCWALPLFARAADTSQAEALFTEGRRKMREGALDEACVHLRQSQELDPAVGTLLNLAECEERRGQLARAWSTWLAAAAQATSLGQADRGALARSRAAALTARLGTLTVAVPEAARLEGLQVLKDGVVLEVAGWDNEAPVDPGEHVLSASAPGYREWRAALTTSAGVNVSVQVPALEREPVPAPPVAPSEPGRAGAEAAGAGIRRALPPLIGVLAFLSLCVWIVRATQPSWLARWAWSQRPGGGPWLLLLVALGALTALAGSLGFLGQRARVEVSAPVAAPERGADAARAAGLEVVRVAGDPWSGYSSFRGEPRFKAALAQSGLALEYLDQAELYDQDKRMQALAEGRIDLALTTIDAYLQHGTKHRRGGRYPGVIVWNIDESNGGDAIFLSQGRAGFDAVQPTDRVCYAAGTPSEHLWDFASLSFSTLDARLVTDNGLVASDCWQKLRSGQVQIAVLWQPSTAIAAKAGYSKIFATGGQADDVIVDVAVVNREYLASHRSSVTRLAKAYFDALDWQLSHTEEHAQLITADCGPDCEGDIELGRAVLDGIDFLTYRENSCLWWGHCGTPAKMPERIRKTGQLLAAKGKILVEELPDPASILDDSCLRELEPALSANPASVEVGTPTTSVRALNAAPLEKRYAYDATATAKREDMDVGTLRLPSIYFPEAGSVLDANAESVVDIIADRLRAFPALCVRIHGHTNSAGNPASNLALSEARARSIARQLSRLDAIAFPAARFDVQGLGSTAPVRNGNQEEDFAASRRTEFKLFRCDQAVVSNK
jgi:outer membrane protein OmpA-like peptidoglycan-associated protein